MLYGTFPCLAVLASSSKFDSNTWQASNQSPEAGRVIACPSYSASDACLPVSRINIQR